MRAVISGGGTGGHIYPALAIAEELRARGDEILYMGGAGSTEEELVKGYGFDFASVATSPLHRNLLKVVGDLAANCRGMHEAKKNHGLILPHQWLSVRAVLSPLRFCRQPKACISPR